MIALWLGLALAQDRCTYSYTVWDTRQIASIPASPVDKPRSALTDAERGPMGCTPCSEDQRERSLSNGLTFQVCRTIADSVTAALEEALAAGVPIESVSGYRPIMSKGELDDQGRRTQLSRHAFGVALDINRDQNGLYGNCAHFGPDCTLLQGGPWRPGADPRSLSEGHPVVAALEAAGLRWGGRIEGSQKDFMHFSPDGT